VDLRTHYCISESVRVADQVIDDDRRVYGIKAHFEARTPIFDLDAHAGSARYSGNLLDVVRNESGEVSVDFLGIKLEVSLCGEPGKPKSGLWN
jgi:hypothetical protein